MAHFVVNNFTVETILSNIKSGSIAIPEMQRPFVWDSSKVRDLIDSLYKGAFRLATSSHGKTLM